VQSDLRERREFGSSLITKEWAAFTDTLTKDIMETERNPNEPGKSGGPGQQGGQEGDREKQERERQQREHEKQGGGGQPGGGQQGGGQQSGRQG
jgi:hypothetical protein